MKELFFLCSVDVNGWHIHTNTHTHIYIYIKARPPSVARSFFMEKLFVGQKGHRYSICSDTCLNLYQHIYIYRYIMRIVIYCIQKNITKIPITDLGK